MLKYYVKKKSTVEENKSSPAECGDSQVEYIAGKKLIISYTIRRPGYRLHNFV